MYARPTTTTEGIADDPGLTPTRQAPVSPLATVDLEDRTVTDLWRVLFDRDAVRDRFIRAIRSFASGRTPADLLDALADRDVPRHLRSKILVVARGDRRRAWHLVTDVVPMLGRGRSTVDDLLATARLFDALEETPTLAVRVGRPFRDRRREQRVDVCRLLDALAGAFDVRLVVSGPDRAWLAHEHREDLPGVSEWYATDRDTSPVDDALATLDPDGREVSLLEEIAEAPGGTVPYHALYAGSHVDKSRVRQCITRLADLGLVEPFGPQTDRMVDLLDAGREFLSELAQQSTLSDAVSDTPQHHQQAVYSRGREGASGGPEPYQTAYYPPADHAAAVACGTAGGVSLVDHPEEPPENDRIRWVSYDEDRDEAIIDVRATGSLQYAVSVATALASPEFINRVLPADRLDDLEDPPAILRDVRCIGWLSDDALEDGGELRDTLVEAGRELADLTRDLNHEEYDDRDTLRSAIMRDAHGLAGSIVHLLEAVGVDLSRVVRVPAGLSFDKLEELARSVGISVAIQSGYGAFAAYRQLFESREDKRQSALSPDVDAADPVGKLLGSFVFRGPDVDRLRPSLEDHVGAPSDVVDDAPEFAVHVPIRSVGRPAFATAATRTLRSKDLSSTREAVSLLHALTGSPYDVTRALYRLDDEDGRDVRPDELRYALATLDADRILPDLPPTVGKIVTALLATDERLSQTDLADRADVSPQSIRRHRDRLADLGLVEYDADGYRLALSFRTGEERRSPVVPDVVDERFIDAVDRLLVGTLPPDRYADPDDPVGGVLFTPPDPWGIPDESDLSPWIIVAGALTGADRPDREVSVSIGPPIKQTAIATAPEVAHAD